MLATDKALDRHRVEFVDRLTPKEVHELAANSDLRVLQTKNLIGDFSPKLVELTDIVQFDDVWERKELSKRDRSLITVAALIARNRPDQLRSHLGKAVENGVKKEELIEAITHLAFYSGWPNAMTAVLLARAFRKT